ncbi:hypothetical protein WMF27_06935 [Sorangium sp. So ce281]|uniref:hypothetical protein n=1 Tax=unclassified Sorangium TaxID=2621164 RepID=UPI003F6117F4
MAAAHVDAAQTHVKNNYMRSPLAAEVFDEEVSNLLKRKIKSTLSKVEDLSVGFDYGGEVTAEDCDRRRDPGSQGSFGGVHRSGGRSRGRRDAPEAWLFAMTPA